MKRFIGVMFLLILFFINAFFLGTMMGNTNVIYVYADDPLVYGDLEAASFASILVPAVDESDNGVVTLLSVQAINGAGTGKILVNIDRIFFWGDTQDSIRTAHYVAENVRGLDLSNIDLVYTITANASVIEGPSAGAALAAATITAVENRTINKTVMITGAISSDGSITQVGGVLAKANASKQQGAELFLVPPGQSTEKQERLDCNWVGWVEYCDVRYETINVSQEAGIEVKEVKNINEALNYLLL